MRDASNSANARPLALRLPVELRDWLAHEADLRNELEPGRDAGVSEIARIVLTAAMRAATRAGEGNAAIAHAERDAPLLVAALSALPPKKTYPLTLRLSREIRDWLALEAARRNAREPGRDAGVSEIARIVLTRAMHATTSHALVTPPAPWRVALTSTEAPALITTITATTTKPRRTTRLAPASPASAPSPPASKTSSRPARATATTTARDEGIGPRTSAYDRYTPEERSLYGSVRRALKKAIDDRSLRVSTFARESALRSADVHAFLKHDFMPTAEALRAMANALGVNDH